MFEYVLALVKHKSTESVRLLFDLCMSLGARLTFVCASLFIPVFFVCAFSFYWNNIFVILLICFEKVLPYNGREFCWKEFVSFFLRMRCECVCGTKGIEVIFSILISNFVAKSFFLLLLLSPRHGLRTTERDEMTKANWSVSIDLKGKRRNERNCITMWSNAKWWIRPSSRRRLQ